MASTRSRALARWAAVALLVACTDRLTGPKSPGGPPSTLASGAMARIQCTVDVRSLAVACPQADTAAARAAGVVKEPAGVSADIMLGGQRTYVTLASSNVTYSNSVFAFDATVENLIPQALGTTDGTTISLNGIRVFFSSMPATTGGTGTVDYTDPSNGTSMVDGLATFTASNQAYYQYDTLLAQNQTSLAKQWRLHVPSSVTSFSFTVYVDAPVQYPNGWIDVSPSPDTVAPNGNATLTATVKDFVGRTVTGQTLTWSSNATSVATVGSSTGIVTAVNPGTATISVTDGTASGSATFVTRDTPPTLIPQSISYPGNVGITVDSAHGFMAGLTDPDPGQNHTLTAPTGTTTLTSGATLTVNTNGSFTYTPAAGQTSTDSIPYTVSDGILSSTSYAKVALSGGMHWYADNTASATGANGTKGHPFTSLAGLSGKTSANDTIFVNAGSGAYSGALTLLSGETLLGQAALASNLAVTLNGATVTLFSTGGTPHLSLGTAGTVITLGSGNTIKGIYVSASSGTGISGSSFGTLTLASDTVLATGGPTLSLTTGSLASGSTVLFARSTSSSGYGLFFSGVSGSLTIAQDSIVSPTTAGLRLVSGTLSLSTTAGAIVTTTGGGRPVDIESNTGGAVSLGETITANASTQLPMLFQLNTGGTYTLSGAITLSTGSNNGITWSGSSGATASFTGGALSVTTTTGAGISVTGGGTINITGAGNTINTTTGTALSVTNTTIGANGLTFLSISSNGAVNGIALSNTGPFGLTVTGGGASDPTNTTQGRTAAKLGGGSITLGSGGTIQNSTGVGVSLNNTNSVVLRNLVLFRGGGTSVGTVGSGSDAIQAKTVSGLVLDNILVSGDTANMGLYGSAVSGLYMNHVDIEGNAYAVGDSATQNSTGTWNVRFDNLGGGDSVKNSLFQNSNVTLFGVSQTGVGGTATLLVSNSKFATTHTSATLGAGFEFLHTSSVSQTLSITRSTFSGMAGAGDYGFYYNGNGSDGGGTLTFSNNTLNGDNQEFFLDFLGRNTTLNYTIASNSLRQSTSGGGNGIVIILDTGTTSSSKLSGTLSNNTLGSSLVQGSSNGGNGIWVQTNGAGTFAMTATANTVKNVSGSYGFSMTNHSGVANLKLRSNDFEVVTGSPGFSGLSIESGVSSGESPVVCLDLGNIGSGPLNTAWIGNTSDFGAQVFSDVGSPTISLYGYTGAANDLGAIDTFVNSTASNVSPSASGSTYNASGTIQKTTSACSTP